MLIISCRKARYCIRSLLLLLLKTIFDSIKIVVIITWGIFKRMIGNLVEINKVRFEEKEILEVEEIKLGR